MKAVVAAFNQEKALVGAFSVITNFRMELFEALIITIAAAVAMCTMSTVTRHQAAKEEWWRDDGEKTQMFTTFGSREHQCLGLSGEYFPLSPHHRQCRY